MKNKLFLILSILLCVGCSTAKNNEALYKNEIKSIICTAKVPLIQVEYKSPKETISLQVENPSFYDSLSIENGTATPHPAVFQAASLSKPLFAYIVMKMYDRGEIDLDTPLFHYTDIDRFVDKEAAKVLTARTVLTHRTGLPNWCTKPSSKEWPTSPIEFKYQPDSCFGYSGESFAYLQRAVEAILGKDIETIAREEVFTPLGMEHTSYSWLPEYDTLAADGYNAAGKNRGKGKHPRANVAYTLRTTAADFSKFLQALLHGEGLKPETAQMMFETNSGQAYRNAKKHRECDEYIAWGLGISTENNSEYGKIIWHGGNNGSFKAICMIIPSQEATLVYFTNSNHGHEIITPITSLFFKGSKPFMLSQWVHEE